MVMFGASKGASNHVPYNFSPGTKTIEILWTLHFSNLQDLSDPGNAYSFGNASSFLWLDMTRLDLGQPTKNKSWEINHSFRIRSYNGKIYSSNNPQTYVGPRDNFPEVPYKPCLGHGVGLMVSTSVKWLRTENIVAQNIIKRKKNNIIHKTFSYRITLVFSVEEYTLHTDRSHHGTWPARPSTSYIISSLA